MAIFILYQQGNTILVDTPGIGGSGEVTHNKKIETITNECVQVRKVNISYIGFLVKANCFSCLDGPVFNMLAAHFIESGF